MKPFLIHLFGFLLQHLAVADDGVEGGAQFVAHVRQERALGLVRLVGRLLGLLRLVLGGPQFLVHFAHRGSALGHFCLKMVPVFCKLAIARFNLLQHLVEAVHELAQLVVSEPSSA